MIQQCYKTHLNVGFIRYIESCAIKMTKLLGVFDFDHTIIQDNSDVVVRNMLQHEDIPSEVDVLGKKGRWTAYMGEIFSILCKKGISENEIRETIVQLKPVPNFLHFFKILKEMSCENIIISDSNTYFIEQWLKNNGVQDCVEIIYSNPGEFVDGRLEIKEFHIQNWCNLSEINICKGYIMEQHLQNKRKIGIEYKTVFYVGDGRNDLCPTLKLTENDFVFPRIGYPLLEKINSRKDIKATVSPWTNTDDILTVLQNIK